MRPASRARLAALSMGAFGSCDPLPNTEILVVVTSDLTPGAELRAVRVVAQRDGARGPLFDRRFPLEANGYSLPGLVALVAQNPDDAVPITVRVVGEVERGTLAQEARVRFERQRTLYLHMTLTAECLDRACDAGLTCRRGVCVSPEGSPLSDVPPAGLIDAGAMATDVSDAPDATDTSVPEDALADGTTEGGVTDDALGPCPEDMVLIFGGRFLMGSTTGDTNEQPVHAVRVSPFCLERTEVTVEAYTRCVRAGACSLPHGSGTFKDGALNYGRADRADHPINGITWDRARLYCAWSQLPGGPRRLPTEAQWEFAARGPEGRLYPWGNRAPRAGLDQCASVGAARHGTCPIRAYPPTESGLFDLAGNVKEWVEDCFGPYVGDTTTEVVDPRALLCPDLHVVRGSSWNNSSGFEPRGTRRQGYTSRSTITPLFGIRCARDPR